MEGKECTNYKQRKPKRRSEEKLTTTVNLGACLAYSGKKVLLVDIDASREMQTSGLGVRKVDVRKKISIIILVK